MGMVGEEMDAKNDLELIDHNVSTTHETEV